MEIVGLGLVYLMPNFQLIRFDRSRVMIKITRDGVKHLNCANSANCASFAKLSILVSRSCFSDYYKQSEMAGEISFELGSSAKNFMLSNNLLVRKHTKNQI